MSIIVPSLSVFCKNSTVFDISGVIFEIVRTKFSVESLHGGAARASLEPDYERVNILVSSRLSQQEVKGIVASRFDSDIVRNQSVVLELNAVLCMPIGTRHFITFSTN